MTTNEWLTVWPQGHGHPRGRDLRHLRRHPRDGGQPDRGHGRARLPGLGLDVQGRAADRLRAWLPIQPDNLSETILYLLYQVAGQAPMIPLDEALRPKWLFEATVHQGCDRAGYYEEGEFATEYGSPRCLVKLGCWGPVVKCNVPKRGWINGVGGCPNVGGICIACTMPGFPDKFMPFMDEPPGATVSTTASGMYGTVIRSLRGFTARTADKEPKWRVKGSELRTGYQKTW